jgi:UDP-N-acetylglucosamine diphosphorylase/glucosamine-1-phosphate N-acetyltransferase
MNVVLFDDKSWDNLLPLTFTRPVSGIRIGIQTIAEKWNRYLETEISVKTRSYLQAKFPFVTASSNLLINSSLLPNVELVDKICALKETDALFSENKLLALYASEREVVDFNPDMPPSRIRVDFSGKVNSLNFPYDIFSLNGVALYEDYQMITKDRSSVPISSSNFCKGAQNIFIEEGAVVENVSLNADHGLIYIGRDAEIMENSAIRGPFALCEHSVVKLGAKVYGPTTIGPHSKVGGELNNVVIFGYTNKGHDGFLGNSVLGEWVNIGADSNNSNLKNNYAEVKLWNYPKESFIKTGLQFCGLIMGDHSKCAINTMFNTGTVVGVFANIFGAGFHRNFIPSFSWGGPHGLSVYRTAQAFEVAEMVMGRRGLIFQDTDRDILNEVFSMTEKFRRF